MKYTLRIFSEFLQKLDNVQNLTANSVQFVYYFLYIACGAFLCASLQVSAFSFQAVR